MDDLEVVRGAPATAAQCEAEAVALRAQTLDDLLLAVTRAPARVRAPVD